jgi:CheY-like chemotaxis protein
MKKFKGLDGILLIDNDLPANFIHHKAIEKAGIDVQVKVVRTVAEALEFLTYSGSYEEYEDAHRPGIIFLHINLPGLSGWDFMAEYHQLESRFKNEAIVVLLTASPNPADQELALKYPEIKALRQKPLRAEAVLELAAKYFEEAE